jgi:hypothetical protein
MNSLLSRTALLDLLWDMLRAEETQLPSRGKQALVIANALARASTSPPPLWAWLLVEALERLIPLLVEYIQKQFGAQWTDLVRGLLEQDKLPWENDVPKLPPVV